MSIQGVGLKRPETTCSRPATQGHAPGDPKYLSADRGRQPHNRAGKEHHREVRAAPPAGHPSKQARTPSGIAQVACLQRAARPDGDSGPRGMGQRGGSRGR